MKAKIRGTVIYYDVAGMQVEVRRNKLFEKPVLFLIHGGPGGNHLHFKVDSLKLQDVAQLVFIDQRGCGWSKKTKNSDYNLENNIEDIEALRKHLGLPRICLLGVSYGGIVSQGYAIRYHKYVEKLILVATAPSYHFMEEARMNLNNVGTNKQIQVCNKYLWNGSFKSNNDVNKYFEIMKSLYYVNQKNIRKKITPTNKNNSSKLKSEYSYEVLNAGFSNFLHHFNFIPKLKKISSPTLVLAGEKDWVCSPNQSRIIAKNIKNSKLKIFKKSSHTIGSDANDAYIKTIKNFLTKEN